MSNRIHERLPFLKGFLCVGEIGYGLGVRGVRFGFSKGLLKTHRLPVSVVSVGNLTWGGTGKTPLVMYLAKALEARGRRMAVLTRGYGRDECQLLSERLHPIPVLVGRDRVKSAAKAVGELGADLLLLDDGYQQWRLRKEAEILTVDAADPFGNGHLIPRGKLREPIQGAARADLIVVKRSGESAEALQALSRQLKQLNGRAPVFWMEYRPTALWAWPTEQAVALQALQGERVCTLAGIAHPESFERTVQALGARCALTYRVRDHHLYAVGELTRLFARCRQQGIGRIVTTAKDAVRFPHAFRRAAGRDLQGISVCVLEVQPTIGPNESEFLHRIDTLLAGPRR